jgi:hypothetical protein
VSRLETVTDANWKDFIAHPLAVLIVAESACPACRAWSEELESHLADKEVRQDVRFGKINIDTPETEAFRAENKEWLDIIEGIPFNAFYVNGKPRASFYGGGVQRLLRRLDRLSGGSGD